MHSSKKGSEILKKIGFSGRLHGFFLKKKGFFTKSVPDFWKVMRIMSIDDLWDMLRKNLKITLVLEELYLKMWREVSDKA